MEGIIAASARPDAIGSNVSTQDAGAGTTTGLEMARRISEQEVASVRLLALELSEDEVTVLAAALTTLLQESDDQGIEAKAGASREEVEAILEDLHTFLKHPAQQSMQS